MEQAKYQAKKVEQTRKSVTSMNQNGSVRYDPYGLAYGMINQWFNVEVIDSI